MDERELQRWNLPGYTAFAHGEPFRWAWAVLWSVWGLTIAGLIVWSDGAWAVAGIFLAWGALMGCYGWRAVTVGSAVIHDWAKSHCTDLNVEMAAMREMVEAADSAAEQGELDEENFEVPDTPSARLPAICFARLPVGYNGIMESNVSKAPEETGKARPVRRTSDPKTLWPTSIADWLVLLMLAAILAAFLIAVIPWL